MGLSTKDLKASEGSLPKTIGPGEQRVKVNSVVLEEYTWVKDSYHVVLNVETAPIKDFEGFFIDKDDESKGRYKGQVGRVKMSQYAYVDGTTTSGIQVHRDNEILRSLSRLAQELGVSKEFIEMDGKYDTIEEFVKAYNKIIPKDVYLDMCVAGKEYQNSAGYTSYDMFLPKSSKTAVAYQSASTKENKLIKFNEAVHLIKPKNKTIPGFDAKDSKSDDSDNPFAVNDTKENQETSEGFSL